jgi:hypothetical protein
MQELLPLLRQLFYGRSQVFWRWRTGFGATEGAADVNHLPDSQLPILKLSNILQSQVVGEIERTLIIWDYYKLAGLYSHAA